MSELLFKVSSGWSVHDAYIFLSQATAGVGIMKWWWLSPISFTMLSPEERRAKMILGGWMMGLFLLFCFLATILDAVFVLRSYIPFLFVRAWIPLLLAVFFARPLAMIVSSKVIQKADAAAAIRIMDWRKVPNTRRKFFGPPIDEIAKSKSPEDIEKTIKACRNFIVVGVLLTVFCAYTHIAPKISGVDTAERVLGMTIGVLCIISSCRELLRMLKARKIQNMTASKH